jgi:hypothetical protein
MMQRPHVFAVGVGAPQVMIAVELDSSLSVLSTADAAT